MKKQINNFGGKSLDALSNFLFIQSELVDVLNKKTFRKNQDERTMDEYITHRLEKKITNFNILSQRIDKLVTRKHKLNENKI